MAKIAPNLIKIGVHAYLSNVYLTLLLNFNAFQTWFHQPWMRAKIAPNLIKIGVHAYLSNGYLNPLSKLNPKKGDKSASFQPWFDQPWTRAKMGT